MTVTVTPIPSEPDPDAMPASPFRQGGRLILRFVREHPFPFWMSVLGGVGWAGMVVAATVVLGRVTDQVIAPRFAGAQVPASQVWGAVLALVAVGVLRGLSVVVRRWFGSLTETRMQASLRRSVADRLLDIPVATFRSRPTGEWLATADVDVNTSTQLLMPLPFSLGVVALVAFSMVSLFVTDWTFALVALLLFPALTWLSRRFTDRVHGPSQAVQRRLGDVSAIAHESFDGALVVKTLGLEGVESERFNAASDRLRLERIGVGRITSRFTPVIDALPSLGMVVLLLVGAWRIDAGAVTPGGLVQAVALFGWLAFPMRIVGFMFESMPRAVASIERVDRVLALEPGPVAPSLPRSFPEGPLAVSFEQVGFRYGEVAAIDSVSLEVAPGEVVAVVGSTGSGKSTLVNLLARLEDPTQGRVCVGGVPIDQADPQELVDSVAVVFQESFLFADSVAANVTMNRAVDTADYARALRLARAERFVSRLPQHDETLLGERGVTLSGGQRQRVALARALARRPRVLVLDDATSAVDPVIEAQILAGLGAGGDHDPSGRPTVLIVAHRVSTIRLADRIVHLDEGRVVDIGTHDELLERDPGYRALVTAYEAEAEGAAGVDDEAED